MASNNGAKFRVTEVILYQVQDTDSYYSAESVVDRCNTGVRDQYSQHKVANMFASQKDAERQMEILNRIYDAGVKYGQKNSSNNE
jgi:hypothetical protein